jgi:hypothetical protein
MYEFHLILHVSAKLKMHGHPERERTQIERFTSNSVLRTPNALPVLLAVKNVCFILVFSIPSRTLNLWCLLIQIRGARGIHNKKISRQKSSAMLILIQINWLKSLTMLADLCTQKRESRNHDVFPFPTGCNYLANRVLSWE